ncbi:MAG: hypothetical protein DKINENOH_03153 [bacterium]|nr:hypothetical protein [bacterium]
MDSVLIDYLRSGKAWVLVGSGPSIEMGYPNWKKLAISAINLIELEGQSSHLPALKDACEKDDFAAVFQHAQRVVGIKRLISFLDETLKPANSGRIYEMIARWPIEVYLTTNFDDEIQKNLTKLGVAYRLYDNSEDNLNYLLPDLSGAIFKLHGDLRSERGLILTSSQYNEILDSESWQYWRTKLISVFQMKRIVIIGHSLTDPHIQHILQAAKKGAGVIQPICWIAPDVSFEDQKKYLEEYRIRVITYSNKSGGHKSLFNLISFVNEFIPPRTTIHIQRRIAEISSSPLGNHAAAPGFYVFNKLSTSVEVEQKRIEVALAALQAVIRELSQYYDGFDIEEGLRIAGWPKGTPLTSQFARIVGEHAIKHGLFDSKGEKYVVSVGADLTTAKSSQDFQHLRGRFHDSLVLRIMRSFSEIGHEDAKAIASDIESSLTGYFREGGLTLATMLFANSRTPRESTLPSSIIRFISEASARYDDTLKRQAFCTVSLDSFINAESAEREFLGRISQGFFAFHAFGAFGDVAIERVKQAKNTVWLIDSSAQIASIALAAPTQALFRDCFLALHSLGIRLFTTERLFDETWTHLQFAKKLIDQNGADSYHVIAAAKGDSPYQKSNQFMEGFIRWQAAGNPRDWDSYIFSAFKTLNPKKIDLRNALMRMGIEVIQYEDWPGFQDFDFSDREKYIEKIVQRLQKADIEMDYRIDDAYKKALPEAEAYVIITNELEGKYYIISQKEERSPAWFISNTSMLNLLESGKRITWQPEAFVRFTTTLYHIEESSSSSRAFETILWGIAQSGLSILVENMIASVFNTPIDQTSISSGEQREIYERNLSEKYGEPPESVLKRIAIEKRQLAAIQLAHQATQLEAAKRSAAELEAAQNRSRAKRAESELKILNKYRKKVADRQARSKKTKRRHLSSKRRSKRKK